MKFTSLAVSAAALVPFAFSQDFTKSRIQRTDDGVEEVFEYLPEDDFSNDVSVGDDDIWTGVNTQRSGGRRQRQKQQVDKNRPITSRTMYRKITASLDEKDDHWSSVFKVMLQQKRSKFQPPWPAWLEDYYYQQITGNRNLCMPSDMGCGGIFNLTAINNYGCWCSFDGLSNRNKGVPQDGIDELCQSLQKCYRCSIMDGRDSGDLCHPWTEEYVVNGQWGGKEIEMQCLEANQDDECAFHTCCCEMSFISRLFEALFEGAANGAPAYNSEFLHSNGFNYEQTCLPVAPSGPVQLECCGAYPDRSPFNSERSTCCNEELFYGQSCP